MKMNVYITLLKNQAIFSECSTGSFRNPRKDPEDWTFPIKAKFTLNTCAKSARPWDIIADDFSDFKGRKIGILVLKALISVQYVKHQFRSQDLNSQTKSFFMAIYTYFKTFAKDTI